MIINTKSTIFLVAPALFSSLLLGCANKQQYAQFGAAAGTTIGNIMVGISAGMASAAASWRAVNSAQYDSMVRTTKEDQHLYGFAPATHSVFLKLNKGYASPKILQPGQQTTIYNDYSLSLPSSYHDSVNVTYEWELKKGNQVLSKSKPVTQSKIAAGHQTVQPIDIPINAESGTYTVETKISSGKIYDT